MFYHFRRLHRSGQSEMQRILECVIHKGGWGIILIVIVILIVLVFLVGFGLI